MPLLSVTLRSAVGAWLPLAMQGILFALAVPAMYAATHEESVAVTVIGSEAAVSGGKSTSSSQEPRAVTIDSSTL